MQWEVFARGCLASLTLLDLNHNCVTEVSGPLGFIGRSNYHMEGRLQRPNCPSLFHALSHLDHSCVTRSQPLTLRSPKAPSSAGACRS